MNSFESYCSRMWLDYEDENITNPNRLTRDQYVDKYYDWLWDKYLLEQWNDRHNDPIIKDLQLDD